MKNRVLKKGIAISVSICMLFAGVISTTDYGWAIDSSKGSSVTTENQNKKEQNAETFKNKEEREHASSSLKNPETEDDAGMHQGNTGDAKKDNSGDGGSKYSDKAKDATKEQESKKEEKDSKDAMPRRSFHKTAANGVTVMASVEQGVFPKETTMSLTAVSSGASEKAAVSAVGAGETVQDAVGVDITFTDKYGHEIQSAQGKSVAVSMTLNKAVEGEHFTVLHQSDDGSVSTVGVAGAKGASFQANSFSIYIISGQGDPAIATYRFHDADGTVISKWEQKVKDGETLYSPKTPEKEGYVFTGWTKTKGADTETVKAFKEQKASVKKTETVDLYPVFKEARYIFFMDQQGRVATTETGILGETVNTADVKIQTESSSESIVAWYRNKELTGDAIAVGETVSFEETSIKLYPKTEKGNYVYFDTGNEGTYIEPAFVPVGGRTAYPKVPKRLGYTFKG